MAKRVCVFSLLLTIANMHKVHKYLFLWHRHTDIELITIISAVIVSLISLTFYFPMTFVFRFSFSRSFSLALRLSLVLSFHFVSTHSSPANNCLVYFDALYSFQCFFCAVLKQLRRHRNCQPFDIYIHTAFGSGIFFILRCDSVAPLPTAHNIYSKMERWHFRNSATDLIINDYVIFIRLLSPLTYNFRSFFPFVSSRDIIQA